MFAAILNESGSFLLEVNNPSDVPEVRKDIVDHAQTDSLSCQALCQKYNILKDEKEVGSDSYSTASGSDHKTLFVKALASDIHHHRMTCRDSIVSTTFTTSIANYDWGHTIVVAGANTVRANAINYNNLYTVYVVIIVNMANWANVAKHRKAVLVAHKCLHGA